MGNPDPRQAVIGYISNTSLRLHRAERGYLAKRESIVFLKEKHVARLRTYMLKYESTTLQNYLLRAILKRNQDGEWAFSKGIQGKMQIEFVVFEEDRQEYDEHKPWMVLAYLEEEGYWSFFGNVIPNGHDVAKIRMIPASGQQDEDKVENGFVIFLSQCSFPVEFEFYSPQDTLLGKQTLASMIP